MFLKNSLKFLALFLAVLLFVITYKFLYPINSLPSSITLNHLQLSNAWVRPGVVLKNTAAYITINNPDLVQDKLLKAECDVCEYTELHNHIHENGIMKMRPVNEIRLETRETQLKPGSLHIMLMSLKNNLKEGDKVLITLTFEKAGVTKIEFPVTQPLSKPASTGS